MEIVIMSLNGWSGRRDGLMEILPEAYTPQVRARRVDRRRQTTRTASLD